MAKSFGLSENLLMMDKLDSDKMLEIWVDNGNISEEWLTKNDAELVIDHLKKVFELE